MNQVWKQNKFFRRTCIQNLFPCFLSQKKKSLWKYSRKTKKESETNEYGIQKSVGLQWKKYLGLTVLVVELAHIEAFHQ